MGILRAREYPFPHDVDADAAAMTEGFLISGCTRCAVIDRLDVPWRILEAALASPGTPAEVRDEMTWKRVLCGEDGVCVCMTPRGLCALDVAGMRGVGFWPAEGRARYQIGEARRRDWYLANAPWRRTGQKP